ncbi:MAG: AI-2E family transporter [Anaerolineales bacterium]
MKRRKRANPVVHWSRPARYVVLVLLIILAAIFIYAIRPIIGPLVIAALLAYLIYPIVRWLHVKLRLKHGTAVLIVFWVLFAAALLAPAALTPLLIRELDTIEYDFVRFRVIVYGALAKFQFLGFSPAQEIPDTETYLADLLHPEQLLGVLRAATENVIWVLVILVSTFYLLLDGEKLRKWGIELFPEPYRGDLDRLLVQLSDVWKFFLRGQFATMLVIGLVSGVTAGVIGLPGAVAIGLLATVIAVLPSVGTSIMIAVAGAVALLTDFNYLGLAPPLYVALTVVLFTAIHLMENYWLRPRILGTRLHLHPGLILVAIIGALTLGGILEALIIVPLIRSAEILGRYLIKRMLAVDPWG